MTREEADAIEQLIEKIEKAEGPDRELDLDAHLAIYGSMYSREALVRCRYRPNTYTSSIDAVVRLIEAKLPGYTCAVYTQGGGKAYMFDNTKTTDTTFDLDAYVCGPISAKTPALAVLAAFLRAYKEQTNG